MGRGFVACICIALRERRRWRKKRKEEGRSRVAGRLLLWGGGENSDNIQATEQGHFSFQMTHCQAAAHTGGQIGPHWRGELQSTASSNYNKGRGECERRRRVRGRAERASRFYHPRLEQQENYVSFIKKRQLVFRFNNVARF